MPSIKVKEEDFYVPNTVKQIKKKKENNIDTVKQDVLPTAVLMNENATLFLHPNLISMFEFLSYQCTKIKKRLFYLSGGAF